MLDSGVLSVLPTLRVRCRMDRSYKVLITDDEVDHVRIVGAILKREGYEVIEAFNGEEALARVKEHSPDLLLLDIDMPGINGLEVCKRLKSDPATKNMPIIMFSGQTGSRAIMDSFDLGADFYLMKPVDKGRLLEKVRSSLKRDELRRSIDHRSSLSTPSPGRPPKGEGAAPAPAVSPSSSGASEAEIRDLLGGLTRELSRHTTLIREALGSGADAMETRFGRSVQRKLSSLDILCGELQDIIDES